MADLELTTTATSPTDTSITITVYEDIDSDNTAENSATTVIGDGTNTYTLTGFDGSSGNNMWVQIVPSTSNITTTASVDSVSVSLSTIPPTTPQNLTSTVSGQDITLNWDPVNWNGNHGHYNVYRAQTSGSTIGDYTNIVDVSAGTTSYTDSVPEDGEKYYYRVNAEKPDGTSSDLSNETSAKTETIYVGPSRSLVFDNLPGSTGETIIDNFNDGSFSEYTGDITQFSVNWPGVGGGKYLEGFPPETGASDNQLIYSTSGLPYYPEQGDRVSCYCLGRHRYKSITDSNDEAAPGFIFGLQSSDEYYLASMNTSSGVIKIEKAYVPSGGNTKTYDTIAETTSTVEQFKWYDLEVDWQMGGTMVLTQYKIEPRGFRTERVATAQGSDGDYTDGGVGFQMRTSGGAADLHRWDSYRTV